jgi:hypothetical protein
MSASTPLSGSSATSEAASSRQLWPLAGTGAGLLGFLGTIVFDIHVPTDGEGDLTTMAAVEGINQGAAHLSIVTGFLSVALLLVLAACWRQRVEPAAPNSLAARVVTQAVTAAAGALSLGYGWKGATAIYDADGMDSGTYDQMGLYVYYILNDFGSYIGWLGVVIAAGAMAWMGLRERVLPLWIGIWSLVPVLAVIGFTGGTGLPGFPGVVGPIWMAVAFTGLALHRMPVRAPEARATDSGGLTVATS